MDQSKEPIRTIGSARVAEAAKADVSVIDVRPAAMYEEGHIPGAVNVPLVVPDDGSMFTDEAIVDAIEAAGVEPSDDVVLYCQTGYHAGLAAEKLVGEGFADIELYDGSMDDWSAQQLPIER